MTTSSDAYWDQPLGTDPRKELAVIDSTIHAAQAAAGIDRTDDAPVALDWQTSCTDQRPAVYASTAQAALLRAQGIDMLAADATIPARPLTDDVIAYIDGAMIGRATHQHMSTVIADWRDRCHAAAASDADRAWQIKEDYWTAAGVLTAALDNGDQVTPAMRASVDAARQRLADIAPAVNGRLHQCGRCGGRGGAAQWPGFTCYACYGAGRTVQDIVRLRDFVKAATVIRQHERHIAARAAAAQATADAHAAAASFAAQHDIADAYTHGTQLIADRDAHLDAHPGDGDMMWEDGIARHMRAATHTLMILTRRLIQRGSLTTGQITYMRDLDDKLTAVSTDAPVVTGDAVTVTGEITSMKLKETAYGSRWVMTVRDDRGFTVWGTVPSAITDADRGSRVTLTAQITASDSDASFGFYKRPRAAAVVDA